MTLPASIRINAQFPFPSLVIANGPVTVTKVNGIWTVGFNISNLAGVPSNASSANLEVLVWNTLSQSFQQATLQQLIPQGSGSTRTITVAGAQVYQASDQVLLINVSGAPGAVNYPLPASSARFGLGPLTFKDIGGTANGNNITITPNGTDTIDGVNAAVVLNDNFEAMTLYPLANGGWWIG